MILRDDYKQLEQSYHNSRDEYSQLAKAISQRLNLDLRFDTFFGDPIKSTEEIIGMIEKTKGL